MTHRPLIHIGYHKTATTWMQRQLFIPAHGYRKIAGHEEVYTHIIRPHDLRFSPEPMQAVIAKAMSNIADRETPVISSELLCGNPFFGGQGSGVYAERLYRIAPEAKILISIRSQLRVLPSVYMQYISRGGTMTYKQFFQSDIHPGYFGFDPSHFEYDLLVSHYQKLFGAENVHILTQESLRSDMMEAVTRLAEFSDNRIFDGLIEGADKARMASYPEHAAPFLRRVNHVQRSTLNPAPIFRLGENPGGLYRAVGYVLKQRWACSLLNNYRPVSAFVQEYFKGRFSESNARLAKLVPPSLDMSDYT